MLMLRCKCIYFQMVVKKYRINYDSNVAKKLKYMIDIHQNKTDLEKKHLNKQMVKSLKGMSMYIYKKYQMVSHA